MVRKLKEVEEAKLGVGSEALRLAGSLSLSLSLSFSAPPPSPLSLALFLSFVLFLASMLYSHFPSITLDEAPRRPFSLEVSATLEATQGQIGFF